MKRWMGIVVLVVGIVLALVAALSDVIGLGADVGTFGTRQIAGTIAGLAIAIAGLVVAFTAKA